MTQNKAQHSDDAGRADSGRHASDGTLLCLLRASSRRDDCERLGETAQLVGMARTLTALLPFVWDLTGGLSAKEVVALLGRDPVLRFRFDSEGFREVEGFLLMRLTASELAALCPDFGEEAFR